MPMFKEHFSRFEREYFEEDIGYKGYEVVDADFRAKKLIATMKLMPGDKVLDVGCAYGFIVQALRQQGIEAWGIDISAWAARNDRSGYFVRASAHSLPFRSGGFDCIYCQGTLEHIPEELIQDVLKEFRRIGKAGYLAPTYSLVDFVAVDARNSTCGWLNEDEEPCGEKTQWAMMIPSEELFVDLCEKHHEESGAILLKAERDPTHTCLHTFEWWISQPLPPTFLLVKDPPHIAEDVYGPSNAYPFQGLEEKE